MKDPNLILWDAPCPCLHCYPTCFCCIRWAAACCLCTLLVCVPLLISLPATRDLLWPPWLPRNGEMLDPRLSTFMDFVMDHPLPPHPISMPEAKILAMRSLGGVPWETIRQEAINRCLPIHRRFHNRHENLVSWPWEELWKSASARHTDASLYAIMLALRAQVPPELRTRISMGAWEEVHQKLAVMTEDLHGTHVGIMPCVLAYYAWQPFPLACIGGMCPYLPPSGESSPPQKERRLALAVTYSGEHPERGMCELLRSTCFNKITPFLLHASRWEGEGQRALMLGAFLDYLVKDEEENGNVYEWVVMEVSAYDTVIQVDETEILRRFEKTDSRMVMSAGVNCHPWELSLYNFNLGENYQTATQRREGICSMFPVEERRPFPNEGGVIGVAREMKPIYDRILSWPTDVVNDWIGGDRNLMGQIWLTHGFRGYDLDVNSTFWATFMSDDGRVMQAVNSHPKGKALTAWDGQKNCDPKAEPSVAVHFGEEGTECFQSLTEELFWNSPSRSSNCPHNMVAKKLDYDFVTGKFNRPESVPNYYNAMCGSRLCSGKECRKYDARCEVLTCRR